MVKIVLGIFCAWTTCGCFADESLHARLTSLGEVEPEEAEEPEQASEQSAGTASWVAYICLFATANRLMHASRALGGGGS